MKIFLADTIFIRDELIVKCSTGKEVKKKDFGW